MNIELFNNLDKDIKFAVTDDIDSSSPVSFKKFPSKKTINFKHDSRYLAFKVPPEKGFSINPKSRTIFEFMEVYPKHPDHGGHDIYLFQVLKLGETNTKEDSGGDGDIDPPNSEWPVER